MSRRQLYTTEGRVKHSALTDAMSFLQTNVLRSTRSVEDKKKDIVSYLAVSILHYRLYAWAKNNT